MVVASVVVPSRLGHRVDQVLQLTDDDRRRCRRSRGPSARPLEPAVSGSRLPDLSSTGSLDPSGVILT